MSKNPKLVIYANAKVLVPTCEVATVGEAPNNFIQWPKRLLKLTSKKVYIDHYIYYYLFTQLRPFKFVV